MLLNLATTKERSKSGIIKRNAAMTSAIFSAVVVVAPGFFVGNSPTINVIRLVKYYFSMK